MPVRAKRKIPFHGVEAKIYASGRFIRPRRIPRQQEIPVLGIWNPVSSIRHRSTELRHPKTGAISRRKK
jgi:hypothetical protein